MSDRGSQEIEVATYGGQKIGDVEVPVEYARENDGSFILRFKEDADMPRIGTVDIRRKDVKRGERWNCEDPEALAVAARLALCWNACRGLSDEEVACIQDSEVRKTIKSEDALRRREANKGAPNA